MFNREACLELTHNWGSEDDDSYKAHNGNEDPKGCDCQEISIETFETLYAAVLLLKVEHVADAALQEHPGGSDLMNAVRSPN